MVGCVERVQLRRVELLLCRASGCVGGSEHGKGARKGHGLEKAM